MSALGPSGPLVILLRSVLEILVVKEEKGQ